MDLASAIVLAAYAVMAAELLFWSVPSEVSTRARVAQAKDASVLQRCALVLPIVLLDGLFLIPPIAAVAPDIVAQLGPVPELATAPVRSIGLGLLVLGKIVTPASVPPLRRALAQGTLAQSGLFARSRHPGLCGMFAFLLGNALVFPCAVLLAGVPLYVLYMHRRALMEEARLHARFPDAYAAYARRVPRYLGLRSFALRAGGGAP